MDKEIIYCPNCSSAIHMNGNHIECQYCGLNIDKDYDEHDNYMELILENADKENYLQTLRKNNNKRRSS